MGEEIKSSRFDDHDFAEFGRRLRAETKLLARWFQEGRFSEQGGVGGFELEAWLVDRAGLPAPINQVFLDRLQSPRVVPELAAFNVELNSSPLRLEGNALSRMEAELRQTWTDANAAAQGLGAELMMIGILPTIKDKSLTLAQMSSLKRYLALNEQILRLRKGRPIQLDIHGRDSLHTKHNNVMLESAATSFQIHLKVGQSQGARFYNASKIVAAPMVAVAANSPYLFGRELWDETRIPLFEQAVSVGGSDYSKRVTFGIRYVHASLMECFAANSTRFPILLPMKMDEDPETLSHVRLHNGTIWRWNRPLIGVDSDGAPHLRIEHRVLPAGPSVPDVMANAAFYYGLVHALARREPPPEAGLPFAVARDNFYAAARHGLRADVVWSDGRSGKLRDLLLAELLPLARDGLTQLELDATDIERDLGIIEARVRSGQNGAAWQRRFVAKHLRADADATMLALCDAYREHQSRGTPVHEWTI